jgi:hypothetical protein
VTEPPSICAKRRVMVSPSPLPSRRRVDEPSTWVNGRNSWASCAGVMPMPVSRTRTTRSPAVGPPGRLAASVIVPCSQNLVAFESRLSSICRVRVSSPVIVPSDPTPWSTSRLWPRRAIGAAVSATSRSRSSTENSSTCTSMRPASIFERSSTSLTSPSRCFPDPRTFSRSGTRAAAPASSASSMSISL